MSIRNPHLSYRTSESLLLLVAHPGIPPGMHGTARVSFAIIFIMIYFIIICFYFMRHSPLYVCMCIMYVQCPWSAEGALEFIKLELLILVSIDTCWEPNPIVLESSQCSLICWAISPALHKACALAVLCAYSMSVIFVNVSFSFNPVGSLYFPVLFFLNDSILLSWAEFHRGIFHFARSACIVLLLFFCVY